METVVLPPTSRLKEMSTAPVTTTAMASHCMASSRSPRNSAAMTATKMGAVLPMGMMRATSSFFMA